jgi:hypothetical protein
VLLVQGNVVVLIEDNMVPREFIAEYAAVLEGPHSFPCDRLMVLGGVGEYQINVVLGVVVVDVLENLLAFFREYSPREIQDRIVVDAEDLQTFSAFFVEFRAGG